MKFFTLFDPKSEWDFVGKIPTALAIAAAVPVICIVAMLVRGFPFGLDFSGGTEMQVKFSQHVTDEQVRQAIGAAGFDKMQVQQFGAAEDNEMLIRIERVSSLTDANIENMKKAVTEKWSALAGGNAAGPDTLEIEFAAEEGDRVSIWLPEPQPATPAQKNTDEAAIDAALTARKAGVDAAFATVLTDDDLDALSAQGFDRGAVTAKAQAKGWAVTAAEGATSEPATEDGSASAMDKALDAQQALLTQLLDEKSGVKLRRTKRAGETEKTTEGAVIREQPYQGKVKYLVNFRGVSADIERALAEKFGATEIRRVEFVDAQVAQQLQTDGALAVLYALFFILIYVAIRFDVFFSPGAVIALVHDAFGALAVFPLVQLEFELPSVAALLTVVGYSINNTIVIYDRIRETMPDDPKSPLSDDQVRSFVNKAINDTFSRTVNTTLTTLCASMALFFFAGGVVQNFAAVLSVGIVLGAFSSTFLAPATYLFFRRSFFKAEVATKTKKGLTREDKARGVV